MTTLSIDKVDFPWRRVGSDALLMCGVILLLAAAVALRFALVTNPILGPEVAIGASLAFGALGVPAVMVAAHLRTSDEAL